MVHGRFHILSSLLLQIDINTDMKAKLILANGFA